MIWLLELEIMIEGSAGLSLERVQQLEARKLGSQFLFRHCPFTRFTVMAPEPNKRHRFEHSETVQTTEALAPEALRSAGRFFRDAEGRVLHLRGVNVAPNAKTPANQPSHVGGPEFFDPEWQRSKASFVGQPFPVDEADEHFARLRRWGFNFLRFNVSIASLLALKDHFGNVF